MYNMMFSVVIAAPYGERQAEQAVLLRGATTSARRRFRFVAHNKVSFR